MSWNKGLIGTAVITGEGVRGYYHKNGYYDLESYAVKDFNYIKSGFGYSTTFMIFVFCYFLLRFIKYII